MAATPFDSIRPGGNRCPHSASSPGNDARSIVYAILIRLSDRSHRNQSVHTGSGIGHDGTIGRNLRIVTPFASGENPAIETAADSSAPVAAVTEVTVDRAGPNFGDQGKTAFELGRPDHACDTIDE